MMFLVLPVLIECNTIAERPVANVLEGNTFERNFLAGFFVLCGGEAMVMGMLSRQARLALGCGCHRSSCKLKIEHGSIIWRSSCVRSQCIRRSGCDRVIVVVHLSNTSLGVDRIRPDSSRLNTWRTVKKYSLSSSPSINSLIRLLLPKIHWG